MSNLANSHKRIPVSFGATDAASEDMLPVDPPLASGCQDRKISDRALPSADPVEAYPLDALGSFWLGGGGLLAGSLLPFAAYGGGVFAVAGVTAAIASILLAIALYWRPFRPSTSPEVPATGRSERQHDPLWESGKHASLLATIHDALGDITIARTLDRRIVRANATYCRLTGTPNPEGMTCEETGLVFRPLDEPQRFDVEIMTPEGRRTFLWHDVIIRDAALGELTVQSIARDVTEERLAARARDEALLKAEYNNAAKSRLLATVSHEIRTPLSGILGMSHLLGQTKLNPEQANYLTGMRQSGNALLQLIEDLLDFSTIEVGRFELRPRTESLRQLIESVVEMLAHRAHEKGIEIGATVSSDIPELMSFDPARLRQVLFNVIGNAVKFTQAGGVLIRATLEGEDLVIAIRDSGHGMTREEQARIFGEFEQAGSLAEKSAGTGLGLTISARIMQKFGGSLNLVSSKGEGTEFTIRFPAGLASDHIHERNARAALLKESRVLLLAPDGAASTAIASTIRTLGGACLRLEPENAEGLTVDTVRCGTLAPTDVIIDHRVAPQFFRDFSDRLSIVAPSLRRIFLVNPEERSSRPLDLFDAWLIRPLREQSLIDVLRGSLVRGGGDPRDVATNDNAPFLVLDGAEAPDGGLSIVLAEDDPVNAMLIQAVLTKAGHAVEHVVDFPGLLHRLWSSAASRPDLVVSDLSMAGHEGFDVLDRIRAHEGSENLGSMPIIVLTADNREESRRRALRCGADLVLAKPADPERLIADIAALADRDPRRTEGR